MSAYPKEYSLPPGKLSELRRKFDAMASERSPAKELGLSFRPQQPAIVANRAPGSPASSTALPGTASQAAPHANLSRSSRSTTSSTQLSVLPAAAVGVPPVPGFGLPKPTFVNSTSDCRPGADGPSGKPRSQVSPRLTNSATAGAAAAAARSGISGVFAARPARAQERAAISRVSPCLVQALQQTLAAAVTQKAYKPNEENDRADLSPAQKILPERFSAAKLASEMSHIKEVSRNGIEKIDCAGSCPSPGCSSGLSCTAADDSPFGGLSHNSDTLPDAVRTHKLSCEDSVLLSIDDGKSVEESLRSASADVYAAPKALHAGQPFPQPAKPPRTFEHDDYLKLKAAQKREGAKRTAPGGHHYEDIDVESFAPSPPDASVGRPVYDAATEPVYELIGPAFGTPSETGGPPPLPSRPPPSTEPSGPAQGATGKESVEDGGSWQQQSEQMQECKDVKRGGLLSGLWKSPVRWHRQRLMKRYASENCLAGEDQAAAAALLQPAASPKSRKTALATSSAANCHTPEISPYAETCLVPGKAMTRASSHGDLSTDSSALCDYRFGSADKVVESNQKDQPPAHNQRTGGMLLAAKKSVSSRDKALMKVNQAFLVLGKARRRSRCASMDEGSASAAAAEEEKAFNKTEMLQKRLQHCSMVKERSHYASPEKIRQYARSLHAQLYQYALVVGLRSCESGRDRESHVPRSSSSGMHRVPDVVYKFPKEIDVDSSVPMFCFPDVDSWHEGSQYQSETYSFVLTDVDGERLYGYCQRYMVPHTVDGSPITRPEVVCITSPLSAFKFFSEILMEFVRRRKVSAQLAEEFLEAAYGRPVPKPGCEISINSMVALTVQPWAWRGGANALQVALAARPWIQRYNQNEQGNNQLLTFTRSADCRIEDASCSCLLRVLSSRQIVTIFGAILNERKVVFFADKLSILSPCIRAFVSLVYPFSWQHTLVPVLPLSLIEVVCSPTPFIVGVLSCYLQQVIDLEKDEVLLVNLDNQKFIAEVGDEQSILPKQLFKALVAALDAARSEAKHQDMMVSEAFLHFFFEAIGSMEEFFKNSQDDIRQFQKDQYVKASENKAFADFVKWFSETQMFDVYIVENCEGRSSHKAAGGYEELFASWLQDPAVVPDRAYIKGRIRDIFRIKARK